ncbi:MAG: leucyl aminopeptidase [Alphaproteobacteria bacterium]|nr:leucyl aminopeptidase [Alphaproteobacteria bacterium]
MAVLPEKVADISAGDLAVRFHGRDGAPPSGGVIAVPAGANGRVASAARRIDARLDGALGRAITARGLKGRAGEAVEVMLPRESGLSRAFLYGLAAPKTTTAPGDKDNKTATFPKNPPPSATEMTTTQAAERAGAVLYHTLSGANVEEVWVVVGDARLAVSLAEGALLRSWEFSLHTRGSRKERRRLRRLNIVLNDTRTATADFKQREAIARGVFFARALVSEPPNRLYPESFVAAARRELSPLGVKVSALDEKQMRRLGMGALLGVAQGSVREPYLLVMEYRGGAASAAPVALVGKGVCFDTGGISLKPAGGMEEMKYDMAGAAAVTGAMMSIAGRGARANVVGIAGLVENMPDAGAQRPSDIVSSASGHTIEVLNTDAEGRLVLADALWYAQTKFRPRAMVDLATLTGAMVVALGDFYAGCFSNSDELSRDLLRAGRAVQERLWRMPLDAHYDRMMDSRAADVQNIGGGRMAGSVTAAQFLQRFVDAQVPWAHLDIAGVAWSKRALAATAFGATGFGVRLLDRYVRESVERRGRR